MNNVYSTVIWTGGLLYDLRMYLIAQRRNVVRHLHFNGGLTIINQIRNMTFIVDIQRSHKDIRWKVFNTWGVIDHSVMIQSRGVRSFSRPLTWVI